MSVVGPRVLDLERRIWALGKSCSDGGDRRFAGLTGGDDVAKEIGFANDHELPSPDLTWC